MGLLTNLVFSGGMNEFLYYFITALVIAFILSYINKTLDFLIPDFLVGLSWLGVLVTFILWIGRNFFTNLWSTLVGKSIIIVIILILLALIFTTEFVKTRDRTIKTIQYITPSPSKIGGSVKEMSKKIRKRK